MNRIYTIEEQTLTGLADAVRAATGETGELSPAAMAAALLDAPQAAPGNAPLLPSYWQAAVDALSGTMTLRQQSGPDAAQLLWCADIHGADESSTARIGQVMKVLMDTYRIPMAAVTGGLAPLESPATADEARETLRQAVNIFAPVDAEKLFLCPGERDGLWGDGFTRDLGMRETYSLLCRHGESDPSRRYGPGGLCCYTDLRPANLRVILLNTATAGDDRVTADGQTVFSRTGNSVLGTAQLTWLQEDALDVPAGWGVILMSHTPLWNVKDGQLLQDIMTAYRQRSMYPGGSVELQSASWGDGLADDPCNTSVAAAHDYAQAAGELIACFHGHGDSIDTDSLPVPSIGIAAAGSGADASARVPHSATETAFDIVTVDRHARVIHLDRVGAGSSRSVSFDGAAEQTYSVTYRLTNAVSTGHGSSVAAGSAYSDIIRPAAGHENLTVTVTMGGTDVTESCLSIQHGSAIIQLMTVQGDIVVTATAAAIAAQPCTVTVNNSTGATVDTAYASGGATMQSGDRLTVTFTSKTAGTLFSAPTATMGGAAFDLAPYLTTGLTVAVDGTTYFKTFTLTDVPVTGDLVLDLLGSAVNRYLFSPSVENGTVPAPGASGGAVYRAQNGSCRLTFIPDAGYGLNPPEGVTESTYISQPWNYSYMTFTDANTGEALDFSTLYKGRNTLSHNADGNYYLQLGACIAYDVVYHIAFEQMPK